MLQREEGRAQLQDSHSYSFPGKQERDSFITAAAMPGRT